MVIVSKTECWYSGIIMLAIAVVIGIFAFFFMLPFWRHAREYPVYAPFTHLIRHNYPAFEKNEDYSWVEVLEKNFSTIQDELFEFVNKTQIKGVDSQFVYQSDPNIWKVIPLSKKATPDEFTPSAEMHFNKTIAILKQIPDMFSAYFSYMEPHSVITPHCGEADGYIRGHLALKIPASLPICGFQVSDEKRSWQEGKVLLFNDLHYHTAFNHSDEGRYILMFDIMRPRYIKEKAMYIENKYKIFHATFAITQARWYKKIPLRLKLTAIIVKAMLT